MNSRPMSNIDKEWLQQKITYMEAARDEIPFGLNEDDSNTLAAMKLALASLEAEPVGYMNRFTGRVFTLEEQPGADTDAQVYVPVYAAPPATVSVPDLKPVGFLFVSDDGAVAYSPADWPMKGFNLIGQIYGDFNACRAAMLQGGDNKDYRAIVERIAEIVHGKVTDIELLTVTVKSMKDNLHGRAKHVTTAYKLLEETGSSLQLRNLIRQRHAEWSQATFGDVGPVGPLKHLSKEALEAAEEPEDLSEWADMQFLLWDAQRRAGISDGEITAAMEEKLKVNMARQWPEPKDGEPRLHIKAAPQQEVNP